MTDEERDRATAMRIMAWDPLTYAEFRAAVIAGGHPDDLEALELVDQIADALAAERRRACAP
jgi:surfactin synthase thioesterase subunit